MGTKAGTDHVIRCVAHEFGQEGIRANSISPGLTETPMTAEHRQVPGLFDAFLAGYPLGPDRHFGGYRRRRRVPGQRRMLHDWRKPASERRPDAAPQPQQRRNRRQCGAGCRRSLGRHAELVSASIAPHKQPGAEANGPWNKFRVTNQETVRQVIFSASLPRISSRSRSLRTLPEAVRGKSATNSNRSGIFCLASPLAATCSANSLASGAPPSATT